MPIRNRFSRRCFLAAIAIFAAATGWTSAVSAQPPSWTLEPSQSEIVFVATQLGAPFEGVFGTFEADIRFDRDDLDNSTAVVTIDVASLDTGEDQRDGQAKGPDFFDVASHPTAIFKTSTISQTATGYLADGTLEMKGITKPVQLPFTLEFSGNEARMSGSLVIDRTEWTVGTGEWLSGDTVGLNVEIKIDLLASK
jgi:polyisoprenoid-binding protein YceI